MNLQQRVDDEGTFSIANSYLQIPPSPQYNCSSFQLKLIITDKNLVYYAVPGVGRNKVTEPIPRTALTIFKKLRSFSYRT